MMTPDRSFEQGLAEIRRRRARVWALGLGYLPAMVLIAITVRLFQAERAQQRTMVVATLPWMALFGIAAVRAGWARCPRCGKLFHQRRIRRLIWWSNGFTRRCLNCQLPLLQSPSDKPPQSTRAAAPNGKTRTVGSGPHG